MIVQQKISRMMWMNVLRALHNATMTNVDRNWRNLIFDEKILSPWWIFHFRELVPRYDSHYDHNCTFLLYCYLHTLMTRSFYMTLHSNVSAFYWLFVVRAFVPEDDDQWLKNSQNERISRPTSSYKYVEHGTKWIPKSKFSGYLPLFFTWHTYTSTSNK